MRNSRSVKYTPPPQKKTHNDNDTFNNDDRDHPYLKKKVIKHLDYLNHCIVLIYFFFYKRFNGEIKKCFQVIYTCN